MVQCLNGHLSITFIGGNFVDLLKAMDDSPRFRPWLSTSGNLLAEIAMRTILAIQEGPGWTICSNPDCQQLYRASRHPAVGRYHFCKSCGKRASWRLSKRASVKQRSRNN